MRAGMYDLRYFLTLKRLIDATAGGDRVAAEASDAALHDYKAMLESCPVSLPEGAEIQRDGLSASWGFADKTTFDKYRLKAAEHIAKLWPLVQKK